MTRDESTPLNLDPLLIPGLIVPLQTEGADGGVNHGMLISNENGLLVQVQPYLNMQEGDWVDVFWGDPDSPVAGDRVLDEHVGDKFGLFISADLIPDGISDVWARITRSGGGNGGESLPLAVLVRTVLPGGIDPEPDLPGHQNLPAPEPELPTSGIIDEEAAKNGIKVTISAYPNMRVFDTITFSWGGVLLQHEVTQEEVDAGSLEILVSEDVILEAGDSNQLVLVYRVRDEVHNPSSEWSMRTLVHVEVGKGLFNAPMIENPDPAADPYDVIDLDVLGEDDLLVEVQVVEGGAFLEGDVVALKWVGTTAQGEDVIVTPPEQTVVRVPSNLRFYLPNADMKRLGRGRGVASYAVTRDDAAAGVSRRAFVTFLGEEQRLPKPTVSDAVEGVLDPSLAATTVIVPGAALEADDTVSLTWLGIRANGTPLLRTFVRGVSGGNAGQPMLFPIAGDELIAPLDGGTLSVHYTLSKGSGSGLELESERERLSVGEARGELPAPFTRPPAEGGVLDPADLPGLLDIVVPPWPGMSSGQTVYLLWRASNGPQHDDSMLISPPLVGQEVLFSMTPAQVEANLGADIELSYRVQSPDAPPQLSVIGRFSIGTREGSLPLPEILEADGNQLAPDDVVQGASVRIAAEARFATGDWVTLRLASDAAGGNMSIEHCIEDGEAGQALVLTVPHGVIDASVGRRIELHYQIVRAAGGPIQHSAIAGYDISADIGSGPVRIMGARFNASIARAGATPRILTALHDTTLRPMLVEWRYEDSQQWTARSYWIDAKPWLKLFARSTSETWECRAANIIGNGAGNPPGGSAVFVAMRDEVLGEQGIEVDMVAWGTPLYGGTLNDSLKQIKNIAEISATGSSYVARLRTGNLVCWGHSSTGGVPPSISGNYVQVRSSHWAFVARDSAGGLYAWGNPNGGVPVPDRILRHKDYVDLCGAVAAFAGRRASGHVVAWGNEERGGRLLPGQEAMDDIVQIQNNEGAFAALRDNGSSRRVIAWGAHGAGGDVPTEIARLTNVRSLGAGSHQAFAIILDTGEAKAWGASTSGGKIPETLTPLMNVVEITATAYAFCARLSDGRVVAWGAEAKGGKITEEVAGKSNIVQVVGSFNAFAALCSDGTVVAWGDRTAGGDTSSVAARLVDVRAIYGNGNAFAALTANGQVVTWGIGPGGGNSDAVQHELNGRVTASRLLSVAEAEVLENLVEQRHT
ncbi:hypothetical protein [Pseudomonas sp. zfem002]|uniref:RCC1 domain-containing protein n=1 Tax=Pseudomonas sp. zfem002 TaxID=3078197 RepID=UPI00292A176C|nr:hypothetical protein [Pseudomonas sp. zfem002]MDU9393607.1 hypothetical protein [Pseudomonas sp. zfem002]